MKVIDLGGTTCLKPGWIASVGTKLAVSCNRIYLGDQNGGRLFVLEVNGNRIGERCGYSGDVGASITACTPAMTTGIANVSDVLAAP